MYHVDIISAPPPIIFLDEKLDLSKVREFYKDDLPNKVLLDLEIVLWKRVWSVATKRTKIIATLVTAIKWLDW